MLHGTIQYHPTDRSKAGHPARVGTRRCRLLVMDVGADDFEMMPSEDDLMDFSATKVQVTGLFFQNSNAELSPLMVNTVSFTAATVGLSCLSH